MALRATLFAASAGAALGWMAIAPIANNKIDMFNFANGQKGNDVISIPVTAGEVISGGALACGRCFCFVMTNNVATKTSYLYNVSFCLVPTPVVNSKLALPGLAYNLHSQIGLENEPGAGEDAFTVLIDHTKSPQQFLVTRITGNTRKTVVDISKYVDAAKSNILPGGTAYCADSETLWVAVSAPTAAASTLVTIDLVKGAVTSNISYTNPILAAHFADCKAQRVGGLAIQPNGATSAVVAGWLSDDGFFTAFDHANLPAGTDYQIAPFAGFFDWNAAATSPVTGVLYKAKQLYALPGLVYTTPDMVPATKAVRGGVVQGRETLGGALGNLGVAVAAVAPGY